MSPETESQGIPNSLESAGIWLLACAATEILIVALLLLPSGPSESVESLSWVLAFLVAIPGGFAIGSRQRRALAGAAPAATVRGLAIGTVALAIALAVRRLGAGERPEHGLIALAALAALGAPFLAAREWRDASDRAHGAARVVVVAALLVIAALFVPGSSLRPGPLLVAFGLAALASAALWLRPPRLGGARAWPLDVLVCVVLVLVVVQLPPLGDYTGNIVYHQGFFLGPANDVVHGRAMLAGAWSQYGVGLIDALGLYFKLVPIGFGTLSLLIVGLVAIEYVCVYAILRLAGLGFLLAGLTVAVAVAGNLFSPLEAFMVFPSAGPLRFGLPYLIVLAAVLAARFPARAGAARIATLLVLALSAGWSFETFVYAGVTYGSIVLVEALADGRDVPRRVGRDALLGLAASAVGVILVTLATLVLSGQADWGPYFEYLRLYTTEGLGQLPIVIFSAGPMMAAAIFFSAVAVLRLARTGDRELTAPVRVAIGGFVGLAIGTFTYYVGRSHPNNLLVLMVPVVALGGLWAHVLIGGRRVRWRAAAAAVLIFAAGLIVVASWPSVRAKWSFTALSLAAPGGQSLSANLEAMADNPLFDPEAIVGVELLERHFAPGEPALVLSGADLTTEILMRSGRRNLLPISHPPEDTIIRSSFGRVRAAAASVPAGTLLLGSPPRPQTRLAPTGLPRDFNALQLAALAALHRRFYFELVEAGADELAIVRLVPKRRGAGS